MTNDIALLIAGLAFLEYGAKVSGSICLFMAVVLMIAQWARENRL